MYEMIKKLRAYKQWWKHFKFPNVSIYISRF